MKKSKYPKYKFRDSVNVIRGFFKGNGGMLVECEKVKNEFIYTINFDFGEVYMEGKVNETDLEKQKEKTRDKQ